MSIHWGGRGAGHISRWSAPLIGAPALSINFLSGTLDSRVTFTRASTATFVGSNGLIQSAAINIPRFDYDPVTLAAKGLLIEEQRINLQTYSEQFDNAVWNASVSLTIAANTTTSPDGTNTADRGTRTTTAAGENMRRAVTTQAINTTYTLSVYVKANTAGARLYVRNLAVNNTITTGVVQFNPADGTVSTTYGSAYVGKATMTAVGNGWYRCSITGTTPAVVATNFIDIGVTDGTSAVGGNAANSVFIWGAQLEAGAFVTSYIPTVASSVTRSPDIASITGTNFSSWYNASEGSFVATYEASPNTFTTYLAASNGVVAQNSMHMDNDGAGNMRVAYYSGSSAVALLSLGAVGTINAVNNIATAYKVNDFAASRNGGAVVTDTAGAVPVSVTQLNIGADPSGAAVNVSNTHIRKITYYNKRLLNSQLQTLTQ